MIFSYMFPASAKGNYGWGLPVQASTVAKEIDFGINIVHVAMFLIFALWGIYFIYLLIRYRHREGVPVEKKHESVIWSLVPDAAVLFFEITLIVLYAIPIWSKIQFHFPKEQDSNVVHIVAEQFAWNIQYPGADEKFGRRNPKFIDGSNVIGLDPRDPRGKDDVVTINELRLPLGIPTIIHLNSKDVIHSFFVPEFRIKQDAVPGLNTKLWVEPTHAGKFEIGCAQLCGLGHYRMRGDVIVQSSEKFNAWLVSQVESAEEQEE